MRVNRGFYTKVYRIVPQGYSTKAGKKMQGKKEMLSLLKKQTNLLFYI